MGLFKKKTVKINELILIGCKLTNDLNADGVNGKNRSKIFDESGIRQYYGELYSGDNVQVNPFSLKYRVDEMSPVISDISDDDGFYTIYGQGSKCKRIKFIDEVVGLTRISINAYACPIFGKNKDFYNNLKVGDKIQLKGLVNVSYKHGYEPKTKTQHLGLKTSFTNETPYCGDLNISIYL